MKVSLSVLVGFAVSLASWGSYTLSPGQVNILDKWLLNHKEYRPATDEDCQCADDVKNTRRGDGGVWKPVPDYHPYTASGDFNADGKEDFAAVVVDRSKREHKFTLIVFNGPIEPRSQPAFIESNLNLQGKGLFFGPPRPKPYRLVIGPFESDVSEILLPVGKSYKLVPAGSLEQE